MTEAVGTGIEAKARGSVTRRPSGNGPLLGAWQALLGLLAVQAILAGACAQLNAPLPTPAPTGMPRKVTFLHTTDTHSKFFPFIFNPAESANDRNLGMLKMHNAPFGGAARMMTLIRWQRARAGTIFHVDSGDIFQGAPAFNLFKGAVEIVAIQRFGIDAQVVGNHEFDNGAAKLAEMLGYVSGSPRFLLANYVFEDPDHPAMKQLAKRVEPYAILERDGMRVAAIGMGNYESLTSINIHGNSSGIMGRDPIEVLDEIIARVKPLVDLIVLISHMGLEEDKIVVQAVRGIGAVFGGHNHIVSHPPTVAVDPDGRMVPIVHSGVDMKYLTRTDLIVADGTVLDFRFEAFPVDSFRWCADHAPQCRPCQARDETGACIDQAPAHDPEFHEASTPRIPDDAEMRNVLERYEQTLARAQNLDLSVGHSDTGYLRTGQLSCATDADCCLGQYCASRTTGGVCEADPTIQALRRGTPELACGNDAACPADHRCFLKRPSEGVCVRREGGGCRREDDCRADETCETRANGTGTCMPAVAVDTGLGNLITTAMRGFQRIATDFAVTNNPGIRANIPRGEITLGKLYEVFPFENTLTTVFLSGVEVQALFDFIAQKSGSRGCRPQASVAGAEVILDCARRKAKSVRIGEVWVVRDYKLLAPFATFTCAINDYIAGGGSGYNVFRYNTTVYNTMISLRDVLVEHLQSTPAGRCVVDGRMRMGNFRLTEGDDQP